MYVEIAAAFVRGRLGETSKTPDETVRWGKTSGLRLHKFKRTSLPRVHRVLGILRGIRPTSLLDIGCGRGTFLWPLLDAFPDLPVTALDIDPQRVADVNAARSGGLSNVVAIEVDISRAEFEERQFDVVTALEVIEHLPQPASVIQRICRFAARFVVASVPSKPDDNPQHLHFFQPEMLRALFLEAGATRVQIEHVPNHMIAVARVG